MRIAVYCTGGAKLGFGHFFRSKTFVRSAPATLEILLVPLAAAEDSHIFNELGKKAKPCTDEGTALNAILDFNPDAVVFDTVACSDDLFYAIKKKIRFTASISPIFSHMEHIDILFTRNIDTPPIDNVIIHKGFEFAIFNEKCSFIPDEIYYHNLSKEYLTIGISMGGGDAPNKTLDILKSVSKLDIPLTFWVLLGEGYRHSYQHLVDSIRKDSNHEIILAKTNRSMWNILSNCSLAILAGGLTTLESVYAGLPSLNIFETDSHVSATGNRIFGEGMAENLGRFNAESVTMLQDRLRYYSNNKSALLQMREKSKGKVDKLASFRIFELLLQHIKTNIGTHSSVAAEA